MEFKGPVYYWINSRSPHPSLQRGQLLLSMPRALAYGVDPARYKTNACPFWDAPYHRFAEVAAMPESAPRTPDRAKRWFSDEAWEDPRNHTAYKVTHTFPGEIGTTWNVSLGPQAIQTPEKGELA